MLWCYLKDATMGFLLDFGYDFEVLRVGWFFRSV
jgi:hypothetical protein